MAHIKIRKGLNIPLAAGPTGPIRAQIVSNEAALDFTPFSPYIQPQLLVDIRDLVATGQPIMGEKGESNRIWTSPATGIIKEIRRGAKRAIESIVIQKAAEEKNYPLPPFDSSKPFEFLQKTGLLSHLWMRPFCLPASLKLKPKSIFIKAIESAPYRPNSLMQLQGNETYFQTGLDLLSSLVGGKVHLICCNDFPLYKHAKRHTAEGPHPVSNPSLHIQLVDPILSLQDTVWTIDTIGVIAIGRAIETKKLHPRRVISLAGEGISEEHRGYYSVCDGADMQSIIEGKLSAIPGRLLSGDPLTGSTITQNDYLKHADTVVCVIPEATERKSLHFFRFKSPSFTAFRAYLSNWSISTRLHGEERAFIDPSIYDRVMPLQIPTVPLIKSILAEDFETAEILGILEVAPEDFALPTFICPSKVEMTEIVRRGQQKMAAETLSV